MRGMKQVDNGADLNTLSQDPIMFDNRQHSIIRTQQSHELEAAKTAKIIKQ